MADRKDNPPINLDALLRDCRMSACQAIFSGGHAAALAALASASVRLFRHVEAGSLIQTAAAEMLHDVSENLGLVRTFGKAATDIAIDTGPLLYDRLAAAQPSAVAARVAA